MKTKKITELEEATELGDLYTIGSKENTSYKVKLSAIKGSEIDLSNYCQKSETYSKEELDKRISATLDYARTKADEGEFKQLYDKSRDNREALRILKEKLDDKADNSNSVELKFTMEDGSSQTLNVITR